VGEKNPHHQQQRAPTRKRRLSAGEDGEEKKKIENWEGFVKTKRKESALQKSTRGLGKRALGTTKTGAKRMHRQTSLQNK